MENKIVRLIDTNRTLMDMFHICSTDFVNYAMGEVDDETMSVIDCATSGFVFIKDGEVISVSELMYNNARCFFETNRTFNQTFHKSFDKIAHADINTLIIEQITHYFSTYGLEALSGTAFPWIPAEELDLPVQIPNKIIMIEVCDNQTICDRVNTFFAKVKQPNSRVLNAFDVLFDTYFNMKIEDLTSFELQIIAYDKTKTVPTNPISVLRYMVYKMTGSTLLVNSHRDAVRLKNWLRYSDVGGCSEKIEETADILLKADIVKMSSIFFRYKKLFLAFKKYPGCANYVNRMRRMAESTHTVLYDVCVQNFTKLISEGRKDDVVKVINNADVYELIKLINLIRYRLANIEGCDAVFSIRNGRTFVKEDGTKAVESKTLLLLRSALTMASVRLSDKVNLHGKKFVLPRQLVYMVPASQKQMVGNIPWGSYINYNLNKAITMGIAWNNVGKTRVDLDLHMHSATEHYGWNGKYRDGEEVLFTGDMTDAKNGAAEAFYFKPNEEKIYCLSVTNYSGVDKVPYRFCVTEEKPKSFNRNYTFDNTKMAFTPVDMYITKDNNNSSLGFVKNGVFTFYGGSLSNNIGGNSDYYGKFLDSITSRVSTMFKLDGFLLLCGADIYFEDSENIPEDAISLMPEDLTVDTFVDILTGDV